MKIYLEIVAKNGIIFWYGYGRQRPKAAFAEQKITLRATEKDWTGSWAFILMVECVLHTDETKVRFLHGPL